ncbi:MAG TPA: RNA 2',3'-cyclic phosphodiesterase [Phycisphaerae bacterium]|nr:RNA 2',3'-cyclic phosphodiesterase [Phycisphaerae bacterium]
MPIRTFLALPLDEEILAGLDEAQRGLMGVGAQVRWVAGVNLHLTLKFLGDVQDADLSDVCEVARQIAAQVAPFEFAVRGLASVPPVGQMRMVWCGIEETTGRLAELAGLAEEAYAELGYKRELRPHTPHLTIGRVKGGRSIPELRHAVAGYAQAGFGVQFATELIVFSSELGREGPTYAPLAVAPLGRE